jgi:two-component system chemotaxis response regulator CheB
MSSISAELITKIRAHVGRKPQAERRVFSSVNLDLDEVRPLKPGGRVDAVGVAVSTDGPKVFPVLLKSMESIPVPVLVAQHMPKSFTESLAEWLAKETHLKVVEGYDCMPVESGMVVILPGGYNSYLDKSRGKLILRVDTNPTTLVKPSANVLFKSILDHCQHPIALILTGMGNDGTEGAKEFVKRGYTVIVQEPLTCVVCGMPCSAIEAGAYTHVMTVEEMGRKLREMCL